MMKWIGVSTNIAISLKMCLQDLSISERSPRDMTNSNEILKALSLWLAPFYGYLCEMATAPNKISIRDQPAILAFLFFQPIYSFASAHSQHLIIQ